MLTSANQQLDSSVDPSWVASIAPNICSHDTAKDQLRVIPASYQPRATRKDKTVFAKPIEIKLPHSGAKWPMDSYEQCPFKPPWPSDDLLKRMERESEQLTAEGPLGPLGAQWTDQLQSWYQKLQSYFEFNPADLASNVRRSVSRWRLRLSYLELINPKEFKYVMNNIELGHRIPFRHGWLPQRYFRHRNPPSLAADKLRAWEAIAKDISHGAIRPVDLNTEPMPHCVCPVRTADKSNGKARFVHNSRRPNRGIPKEDSQCELESILRTRNMYVPNGYIIGSDFRSGYHCLYLHPNDRKYLAFALHVSELPESALTWLRANHPGAYHHPKRCYIFLYDALPFGLSSACRAFNSLVAALVGFWRTLPIEGESTRVSSYIDDVTAVQRTFRAALRFSINIVYESASLGLALSIEKCSFFPRHSMKVLGTIVDLTSFSFRVSGSRVVKINNAIRSVQLAVEYDPRAIPARLIASFIGLIWSVSVCCHRAASVMLRSVTAVLAEQIRESLQWSNIPLSILLSRFWSGNVHWTQAAQRQLDFWSRVDFKSLSAPISADVLGKVVEAVIHYPDMIDHSSVSLLFQDASATAAGGGLLHYDGHTLSPQDHLFLAQFSNTQSRSSSTLRELIGILWCLKATNRLSKHRIVFFCDNLQSVSAIKFGSRIGVIQEVAELIFKWCLEHNKICWPVWLPRSDPIIREADKRSRLTIPHDERSPPQVVEAAARMAESLWNSTITFDQAASHRSSITVRGRRLPFNAFCHQPGAAGVDTFRCWSSWKSNINYIYPPAPMTGRLVSFLPSTQARVIVALPQPRQHAWWHFAIRPNSPGVLHQLTVCGFLITAFDFSSSSATAVTATPGPHAPKGSCKCHPFALLIPYTTFHHSRYVWCRRYRNQETTSLPLHDRGAGPHESTARPKTHRAQKSPRQRRQGSDRCAVSLFMAAQCILGSEIPKLRRNHVPLIAVWQIGCRRRRRPLSGFRFSV